MSAQAVWKFPLALDDEPQVVMMPAGAQIVYVDRQNVPTMWAVVDPAAPLISRVFCVAGTGHQLDEWWYYVGSLLDAPFVWHVFEDER